MSSPSSSPMVRSRGPLHTGQASISIYLGLGTNLGDREANLRETLQLLQRYGEVLVVSSIYETAPWGYLDQPDFLNCVCAIATELDSLPKVWSESWDAARTSVSAHGS